MENEIVLFETEDHEIKLNVAVENNTVWLNRKQLAELFGRDVKTIALIVKVVVSKNIYFLFVQVIRYCSVPDVSINKLSTFIGNHVRHRILPDHHHFE